MSKRVGMKRRKSLNPLLLLDYRCYAPDGKIGTNYPPALTQVGCWLGCCCLQEGVPRVRPAPCSGCVSMSPLQACVACC